MSKIALSCETISCARGGAVVLADLSLTLNYGTALILKGPNGSGKTTVLRSLAGLQKPIAGSINGDLDDVAYCAHANGVKASLTVAENLSFWASIAGVKTIDHALNAMNLSELQDRPAANLSAGQTRRLGLARLLVSGCAIWVMDEPTVALDAASVALFGRVVMTHLQNGGAAIMATHIGLGLNAPELDLSGYKPKHSILSDFDEAFL